MAGLGALVTAILVGAPTDVVPNPLSGRSVPVQWWNYPALAVTAALAGIVLMRSRLERFSLSLA